MARKCINSQGAKKVSGGLDFVESSDPRLEDDRTPLDHGDDKHSENYVKDDDPRLVRNRLFVNSPVDSGVAENDVVYLVQDGTEYKWATIDGTATLGTYSWGIATNVSDGKADILFQGVFESDLITAVGLWYADASGEFSQTASNVCLGVSPEIGILLINMEAVVL